MIPTMILYVVITGVVYALTIPQHTTTAIVVSAFAFGAGWYTARRHA